MSGDDKGVNKLALSSRRATAIDDFDGAFTHFPFEMDECPTTVR
jgi:hypothetical protein